MGPQTPAPKSKWAAPDARNRPLGCFHPVEGYWPAALKPNGEETTTKPPPLGLGNVQVRTRPATHCSSSELPAVDWATDEVTTLPSVAMVKRMATLPPSFGKRLRRLS